MDIIQTKLKGVYLITPKVFEDERGWFKESFRLDLIENEIGKIQFVQDNHSLSIHKHTLRGIHFQIGPYSQSKLVSCIKGSIIDLAIDLREDSPQYLKWVQVELSASNHQQLFIPKGFGHAFLTLEENTEVLYKVDEKYHKEADRSLRYDDPDLNISWPDRNFVLSKKDIEASLLKDMEVYFK